MGVRRLHVDRVPRRVLRHRRVERGVEDRHLRQVGAQRLRGADAGDVRRVVQRRHRHQALDLLQHLVGDHGRLGEPQPAVHHPVADRGQFGGVQPEPVGCQLPGGRLERRVVVGDPAGALPGLAAAGQRGVDEPGGLLADPLDQPGREPGVVAHVEQLVLHRGGTGVEDEHPARLRPGGRRGLFGAGHAGRSSPCA